MLSLIFYMSNLKINKNIKFNAPISSLSFADIIFDSQEVAIFHMILSVEPPFTLFDLF